MCNNFHNNYNFISMGMHTVNFKIYFLMSFLKADILHTCHLLHETFLLYKIVCEA
jgi:hypothetical protein